MMNTSREKEYNCHQTAAQQLRLAETPRDNASKQTAPRRSDAQHLMERHRCIGRTGICRQIGGRGEASV
jgi:hypothetical protein